MHFACLRSVSGSAAPAGTSKTRSRPACEMRSRKNGCGAGFLNVGGDVGAAGSGRRSRSAQARSRGRLGRRVSRSLWGFAASASADRGRRQCPRGTSGERTRGGSRRRGRRGCHRGCWSWGIGRPLGTTRASGGAAGWTPAWLPIAIESGHQVRAHDVSILITIGVGAWYGISPRAKISMTSMREPQHGQGRE